MEDIVGKIIGIYEVQYLCDYKTKSGKKLYHIKCTQCGFETDKQKAHIGMAKNCKHMSANHYIDYKIHFQNIRIKDIFRGMIKRCYNPSDKNFNHYGAKGIKICDEWLSNRLLFEEWALANGYNETLSIDRIDPNKDYSPDNCRWVTLEDNAKYKSTTSLINVDGEIHSGKDWSKILGLGKNRINTYIRKYGLDNVIEFIRRVKGKTLTRLERNQSYYDYYMNNI